MKPKILLVEDDETVGLAYSFGLDAEGFEVNWVRDGSEALAVVDEYKPDLILLDILMPKMNGFEFLHRYDPKRHHPEVVVVIFSNISTEEQIEHALMLGAHEFLIKAHYTPPQVADIIRRHLDRA